MDSQELQKIKNKFDIVGNAPSLNLAIETAVSVAPTDLSVLITGESGVGKEVIPQIIHQFSRRKNGRYLAVNCGAIPEGTINAELFGHEKGSFTGAIGERKGYFEEANGGTLFLDEIGELPKETQAMLLRVLQSGEFIKVGSSKAEKTDVRIIAATNVNLQEAVRSGRFREDLYYRLNAVKISMPSLRDRKEDIYLLFRKFTSDFSEKYNLRKVSLSTKAIAKLCSYRWPGNVRQLKNVTEAVTAMESGPVTSASSHIEIDEATLARYMPDEQDSLIPAIVSGTASSFSDSDRQMFVKAILDLKGEVETLKMEVSALKDSAGIVQGTPAGRALPPNVTDGMPSIGAEDAEWQEQQEPVAVPDPPAVTLKKANDDMILQALERNSGNVKDAAKELGISERTIYRRLADKKK